MNKKVLILTDKLKYNCGVTTYLYNFLSLANKKGIDFYLCTSGGDRIDDFKIFVKKIYYSKRFDYYNKGFFNTIYYILNVFVICFRNNVQIIHSQNYYVANVANIVRKFIRVKTIQTHNNLFPEGRLKHFVAERHIVVNEHIYDDAISIAKISSNNVDLIRYGIKISKENCIKDSRFIIVSAARLIEEKGLDTFITAVSMLSYDIKKKCDFCIAGEGEYEKELMKLNIELNAGIEFLGKINGLQNLLKKSKIFVNPSKWNCEGFPFTLIEAGYYKNLVITSNFRGVLSVFDPQEDGILFEKGDFYSLKKNLEEAIIKYDCYKTKIENFHIKVKNLFDINTTVTKTIDIYNSL